MRPLDKLTETIKLTEWRPEKKLPAFVEGLPKIIRDLVIAIEKAYSALVSRVNWLLSRVNQDLQTSASPTFIGLTLSGVLNLGAGDLLTTGNVGFGVSPSYPFHLVNNTSVTSPVAYITSSANRPLLSLVNSHSGATTWILFTVFGDNVNDKAFGAAIDGETYGRFLFTITGKMEWGPGTGARDTNLYRNAANVLKTDDSLIVGANLKVEEAITGLERSSDPSEPAEGEYVMWMSDGSGKGDDGDVLIASNPDGNTKWGTLFDYSAGAAW